MKGTNGRQINPYITFGSIVGAFPIINPPTKTNQPAQRETKATTGFLGGIVLGGGCADILNSCLEAWSGG